MTLQSPAPLECNHLSATSRRAREMARRVTDGDIDIDPPYQRGQVWSDSQRMALIRSWMLGLPTGVVILSDRAQTRWTGPDPYAVGAPIWALIDGKQRLSTAVAWFADEFAVPASWFPEDFVEYTVQTSDGPYVRHGGLTVSGRRKFENLALLAVAEFRSATSTHDEAEIYLLVNGGGTAQTDDDMQRARNHAMED